MSPTNKNKQEFYETHWKIWEALSDGKWHRTKNLIKTTKLTAKTLHKHLKLMLKNTTITRKRDVESGRYPIPVLYRAHPELLEHLELRRMRKYFSSNIDATLKEANNDPLLILDSIHAWSQIMFLRMLEQIQKDKKMPMKEFYDRIELYLWINYEYFTENLLLATAKIIDKIDIKQLIISETKRQEKNPIRN
jgi:DNA-binding MarR family transcriptional regulator